MSTNAVPGPFRVTERVRWADVDLVGIMRFSAVPRFVEMAEQELLREAGLPNGMRYVPEVWMPRRHFTIDYLAPARLDDELTLLAWISRLGTTSLTLSVDLAHADGRVVARTALVIVCVTAATFDKRPLPTIVRERLSRFHRPVPEADSGGTSAPASR
jgi:YbgC/YbaW family acyl-CoA thioester hydrolase